VAALDQDEKDRRGIGATPFDELPDRFAHGKAQPLGEDLPGESEEEGTPADLIGLIGESPDIVGLRETIRRLLPRLADTSRPPPVLIQGETGTGKGLLARAIHRASPRRDGPFVDVNCAAIPETMLEAELFGFERGAFTDARQAKEGLFQAAHRGSLFLDELGLLPWVLQGKLLTVLEDRVVRRLGSTRSEPVDVWILAATSSDLGAAMRAGRFHDALYHRLSVLTLRLPPLRERGADIVLLAEHFLARACRDHGLPPRQLHDRARASLLGYPWPGNVRELANVIERVALLTDGSLVTAEMLGLGEALMAPPRGLAGEPPGPLRDRVAGVEREQIAAALRRTRGNITHAAARLGIPANTLRYRIQKLGLRSNVRPARARAARPPVQASGSATDPASGVVRWHPRRVAVLQTTVTAAGATTSPPETTRAIETLVEKVRTFGGRVEELAPGCVVAAFGIEPVEDAVRRAAHAARAIQAALARARTEAGAPWSARLGLHTEPFLVGQVTGVGPVLDLEAKRKAWAVLEALVSAAEPDTTLVSAEAAAFLNRRFDLFPAGELPGRGLAYRLADAERSGSGLRGQLAPFVGRDEELDQLRHSLDALLGGRGQAVTISGDAGIGKSRLLHEFRQLAEARGARYLEGRCVSYGGRMSYLPFADVIRALCGITDADSDEALTDKIVRGLAEVGQDPRARASFILGALGKRSDQVAADAPTSGPVRTRTSETIQQWLVGFSRRHPIVLAIEDLHWSDPASEELLWALTASLPAAVVLLVVTYRSGHRPPWPATRDVVEITLEPLSREESFDVLRSLPETARVPESAVELLLSRSEGNPFFLEELARAVGENPRLGTSGAVPATVQEVLLSRIERLAPEDQSLLRAAAVIGRDVPLVVLRGLSGYDDEVIREGLARLCSGQFLREGLPSGEPGYTFKHALTQEVAYDTLAEEERRRLHARTVEAIEAAYPDRLGEHRDRLAHHVARGEVWSKALAYFRAAPENVFAWASAYWIAGDHTRAIERAHTELRATTEFRNFTGQLETIIRLGRIYYSLGAYRQALEVLQRNIVMLGDDPGPRSSNLTRLAVLSRGWLALSHAELGEFAAAQATANEAVAAADKDGDAYSRAVACSAIGTVALLNGEMDEALRWLTRARASVRVGTADDLLPLIEAPLGLALALAGRLDEGLATLEEASRIAEDRGLVANHALRLAWYGEAERLAGRLDRAEALATRALELARKHGERGHEAWALLTVAALRSDRGAPEDAGRAYREALALSEELGMQPLAARCRLGLSALGRARADYS
jgi:two-component system response regulator AtoC